MKDNLESQLSYTSYIHSFMEWWRFFCKESSLFTKL